MEQDPKPALEKEQKQVNRIYAALSAMIIFSCLPVAILQVIGIFLLFYVMIGAYVLRARYPEESLVHNHMTWLIRSFWISGLFFAAGFAACVFYLSQKVTADSLAAFESAAMTGTVPMTGDLRMIIAASLVTMGPSMIYFVYRAAKGLSRALKGHRMGNVKEWF